MYRKVALSYRAVARGPVGVVTYRCRARDSGPRGSRHTVLGRQAVWQPRGNRGARGALCALRDDNARWDWADLALDAAGAPGGDDVNNGSGAVLDTLIAGVAERAHVGTLELRATPYVGG